MHDDGNRLSRAFVVVGSSALSLLKTWSGPNFFANLFASHSLRCVVNSSSA